MIARRKFLVVDRVDSAGGGGRGRGGRRGRSGGGRKRERERTAAVEEEKGDVSRRVASKDEEIMKRIKCVRSAIIVAVGR